MHFIYQRCLFVLFLSALFVFLFVVTVVIHCTTEKVKPECLIASPILVLEFVLLNQFLQLFFNHLTKLIENMFRVSIEL